VGARASVPPSLPVEVGRPCVDRILDAACASPLTIVTAGPGWGKTTTVASWVRRRVGAGAGATAWLTMSPADDNPASFWDSVLTAIRRSGVAPEHHPLSQVSAAGGISDEVLLALFRGIADLPQPLLLVLDDFHVIGNEDVMIALTDLASHSTPVHLMVLTRVDPPLSLHRLRMSGALSEVSASDLAFDAAAIRSLASAAESLDLSPRDVQDVLVRTEGWPTGVRLATMYLARAGQEPSLGGFGGTDRSVAEFLVAEVLERQDPEMRDFLMRTSIVDVISGSLADAIVPRGDGRARLEVLEHGNQFVVCVDRQQTLYRYHPLLRDLLQYSLQRDIPGGSEQAHRAAATWYRGHGDPLEALHHAVAAADWSLAASVFVDASPELVGVGRSVLHGLLQGIPFDLIPPSADLELCAAALEYVPGHFIAMEEHVSRARRLIEDGDALPPLALALLENLACVGARARGDEAAVAATAAAALEQVSRAQPGWATEGIRIIATNQCAVALLRDGKITAARERLRIVVRDEPAGEVPLTVLAARGHLAWCDLVEGDLYAAHTAARRVIDDASVRGWTTQTHARHAYLALALVEMLWGHTETADRAAGAGVAADVNGAEAWASIALHLTQVSIAASRRRPRAHRGTGHGPRRHAGPPHLTLLGQPADTRGGRGRHAHRVAGRWGMARLRPGVGSGRLVADVLVDAGESGPVPRAPGCGPRRGRAGGGLAGFDASRRHSVRDRGITGPRAGRRPAWTQVGSTDGCRARCRTRRRPAPRLAVPGRRFGSARCTYRRRARYGAERSARPGDS
jgi:LuxR family maltose regulon positive regulatory protein